MCQNSHTNRLRFDEISDQSRIRRRWNSVLDKIIKVRRASTNTIERKPSVLLLDPPQVNSGPQDQAHLSDSGKHDIISQK